MTLTILAIVFVAILSLNYDGTQRSTPKEIKKFVELKEAKTEAEKEAQKRQQLADVENQRLSDIERRQNSRSRALAAAQQFNNAFKNNTGIKA